MTTRTEQILIIDPDEASRQELARHLRSRGFYVTTCESLAKAVGVISHEPPDIIFADMSPDAIQKLIQGGASLGELTAPVVAFSAAQSAEQVVAALRAGASDFVIKPLCDKNAVDAVLSRLFERVRVARLNEVYREELETKNLNLSEGISELRADQTAGRKVQMKMLPEKDRVIGDLQVTHVIHPSLYLSGDFLDYVRLEEHLSLIYIADVSGHGASSAFVTVLLKNLTNRLQRNLRRGSSDDILDPERFLKRVNRELQETGLGKHVTMFVGLIDSYEHVMRYAVGAHFPLPIISSVNETRFLQGAGLPVGLFSDPEWETYTEPLPEGFHLILFSDGILEVIDAKTLDQKEKCLLELVRSGRHTISDISEALEFEEMSDLPDDIAILTVTDGLTVDE